MLSKLSLHAKIFFVMILLTISIAALTVGIFINNEANQYQTLVATFNDIINRGSAISSAMIDHDNNLALEDLQKLKLNVNVNVADIYSYNDKTFAKINPTHDAQENREFSQKKNETLMSLLMNRRFDLIYPILNHGEYIGAIHIESFNDTGYLLSSIEGIVLILLMAIFVSIYLEGIVTKPLSSLSDAMKLVTQDQDYSIQVKKQSNDEIGNLVDAFNLMLNEIKVHNSQQQLFQENINKLAEAMDVIMRKNDYSVRFKNESADNITGILTKAFNKMLEKIQITNNLQFSIAEELSRGVTLNEISSKLLELICFHLKWQLGVLWIIDVKQDELTWMNAWAQDKSLETIIEKARTPHLAQLKLLQQVIEQKSPLWVVDISKTHDDALVQGTRLKSCICFPISFNDTVYGVIECFSQRRQEHDLDALKLFSTLGNHVGGFIQRVRVQERIDALNTDLVKMSRLAGMSEVATGVLHNVGNVLNSVNISSQVLHQSIKNLQLERLSALVDLLNKHSDELGTFLATDEKGKYVLPYMNKLSSEWSACHEKLISEVESIEKNVNVINNVVSSQQSISKMSPVNQSTILSDVIKDILNICNNNLREYKISIKQDEEIKEPIFIDKFKVEQILINLVQNAIDALKNVDREEKCIYISSVKKNPDDVVVITIKDNGEGISKENLTKLFSFGFTTKESGHGFGLHASALSAQEMGGSLEVESDGLSQGAIFTLQLPLKEVQSVPADYVTE